MQNGRVTARRAAGNRLPAWRRVLVVVAHPDDESFGLGAVLAEITAAGAAVTLLCLTHGEASTLPAAAGGLHDVRARELAAAAAVLGLERTALRAYPDGRLADERRARLAGEVLDEVRRSRPDGLLVFDPSGVTGHPDHAAATAAAVAAAELADLPVLGWTVPDEVADRLNAEHGTAFTGTPAEDVDLVLTVDRTRQRAAITAHASQAVPTSVLWRRLELLGDSEYLRLVRDVAGEPIPAS